MGRPRKTNILNEFERVKEPDFVKLAKATVEAQGHRTPAEFAALCGVHPSTIWRIVHSKVSTAISDNLLITIAANAEYNNGRIFTQLLEAHGVAPRKDVIIPDYDSLLREKMQQLVYLSGSYGVSAKNDEVGGFESRTVQNAKEIILNELIRQDLSIKAQDPRIMPHSIMTPVPCDFAFTVDSAETRAYYVLEGTAQKSISRMEQMFCMAYLNDLWGQGIMLYVVLFDKGLFERLKESLKEYIIPDSVSLLLLDIRSRKTVETYRMRKQ